MVDYCNACGQPATGRFDLFYENKSAGSPQWNENIPLCATHQGSYAAAGHIARPHLATPVA